MQLIIIILIITKAFKYYNHPKIKPVELKAEEDQEEKELLNRNNQAIILIKQLKEAN